MVKQTTSRLKCNKPIGRMPVLQFMSPAELQVDADYQRDLAGGGSQTLIRRIAQHWNWDLCQPLVVARRTHADDGLFVIDGQHRLAAARLRGDIAQLPCIIISYSSVADEAANFVHLNQERRRLTELDLFKASVASGDTEATAIVGALTDAGLALAPHTNHDSWKPGVVSNIGGIRAAWRQPGPAATRLALIVMGAAYAGKQLRYAGTIFPGLVAICAAELRKNPGLSADDETMGMLTEMVAEVDQLDWRADIMRLRAAEPGLKFAAATARVFQAAWADLLSAFMDEAA